MFTLMALFGVLMIGAAVLAALVMLSVAAKVALKVVLLPLKLILFPVFAVVLIFKLAVFLTAGAVIIAAGAVILAALIPIAIICAIFAAPFVLAAVALG